MKLKARNGNRSASVKGTSVLPHGIFLQKRLAHLASFPELNTMPIAELDMEGSVVYANPSILRIFPKIKKEGLKNPLFCGLDMGSIKWERRGLRRVVLANNCYYDQNIVYVPEGETIRIYHSDVTEMVRLEKVKDDFITVASHELKTPLTSIKAFTQILRWRLSKLPDKDTLYMLSRVDEQIEKLTNLVVTMLDVSKIQSGRLVYRMSYYGIDELVCEVVKDISMTVGNDHRIQIRGKSGERVRGDRFRIGQVLANLLINAIKYSPNSNKIVVNIKSDKKAVTVGVRDFGIGIPSEKMGGLFSKFYRVNQNKKEKGGFSSLGLGLYISAEIIKRHEGKIGAKSKLGEGSTFYFKIPIKQK